ncbi:MAG: PAS domain-containing protein [Planctomycetota bacterium]|nr:PAS domain-containing protein [Planctomycetota bacterium]
MTSRHVVMLGFRAVMIACLVVIAVRATLRSAQLHALLAFLPAMAALASTLLAFERRPGLRPLAGLAWVLVFDLVVMGLMIATLGETSEPELLAFLLLGLVIATSRDLLAGTLAGTLAAGGFSYLALRHGIAASPLEPLVLSRGTLFLAAGVFTGLLSREAEQEREVRALQTAELRQELADLGEHLKNVLSSVASGVLAVDAEGRVSTYNRAAERILGVPEHKVVGRGLRELDDLAPLVPVVLGPDPRQSDSQSDGPVARPDVVFRRPDGREARIGYATTPLENIAGRRLGMILVFQDVTLIRDYEARMLRQEQLAALGRLVSGIAHEFGNLLGGARGHVDLALGGTPDEAVEALPIVKETLDRALVTIENLLRFARGTPINRSPGVALDRVVDRALHLLQVELDSKEVAVERRFAATPPLCADATQLEQVFVNMIINTVHALHDRTDRRLRVTIEPRGAERVAVIFEDSGPGVPRDLAHRIFEPFFTTKGPLGGSKIPGTGLGLSMALGVVEAHAGSIAVDASPDLGGARFSVHLPSTAGESPTNLVTSAA